MLVTWVKTLNCVVCIRRSWLRRAVLVRFAGLACFNPGVKWSVPTPSPHVHRKIGDSAHEQCFIRCPVASPAKIVWLVDARPRDIAKFKMAAIPPSFVYSSGKKIICGLTWVANAKTDFFRYSLDFLLSFCTYSYGIRSLRCSRFGRFTRFNFGLV